MVDLKELEHSIFARNPASAAPACILVLGAPRTGSTFLYQALVSAFRLPFIDNLTNQYFSETPVVGLMLGAALRGGEAISFKSQYGKVDGLVQPSEGSRIMAHWFGGGHPSQLTSSRILDGREPHMRATFAAAHAMLGGAVAVKNAWNCFRTEYLASALPESNFIWIRRDIRAAAKSDLLARYMVQGDPRAWNSATPANVDALRLRPPHEQVVENQLEFSQAILKTGKRLPADRFVELWYEDLIADPNAALLALGERLSLLRGRETFLRGDYSSGDEDRSPLGSDDALAIDRYVASNIARLEHCLWS
jgi:hypothetical protein